MTGVPNSHTNAKLEALARKFIRNAKECEKQPHSVYYEQAALTWRGAAKEARKAKKC